MHSLAADPESAAASSHRNDPIERTLPKSAFAERFKFECELALREDRPLSVAVVDLDHFKSINDAFGHSRGDQVLDEFTFRLNQCLRETDFVFRFGGDEYVLLLPGAAREPARAFAERLLQRVRSAPFEGDPPLSLSLSIGVASFPEDEGPVTSLLDRADHRLYLAKRLGRGRVMAQDAVSAEEEETDELGRLVERDAALETAHRFLEELPRRRRGTLVVRGVEGSGRTRFLLEVRRSAELLQYRVVTVTGRAALRDRAFDALLTSRDDFGGIIPIPGTELDLHFAELIGGAKEKGLLLLIDNLQDVDEATLDALDRLARSPRLPSVGVVCTLDLYANRKALLTESQPVAEVLLEPLSREATRTWLRTLLRQEPSEPGLDLITAATGGLPGAIRVALDELADLESLGAEPSMTVADLREAIATRLQTPPSYLPSTPASIVGRSREIEEGKRLVASGRLLTLLGPGGIGKTRLALQIARESADTFEHGVYFAALSEFATAESLTTGIAQALGVQVSTSSDLKLQLYDYLRDKSLLLVLDNLDQIAEQGTLILSELLSAAPQLRLLVTSRERLHLYEEVVLTVNGLAFPRTDRPAQAYGYPAVQLFMQRAKKIAPRFSASEEDVRCIARICAIVEGMPLAIEMAAAMMRALTPLEIERQITDSLGNLVTPLRDVAERHRNLRSVVDSSWRLLSAGEQRAARRVAIFPHDFTVDAALSLGVPLPALLALADKSILRRASSGRFEMHRVLRQFVTENTARQSGEDAEIEQSFISYYGHFLNARRETVRTRGYRTALEEIAGEIENIRFAWRKAIALNDQLMIRLSLDALFEFYERRGWYRDGCEMFGWAAGLPADADVVGPALSRYAHFCLRTAQLEPAASALRRSYHAVRSSGDTREQAFTLRIAAELARARGKYRAAGRLLHTAIDGFRSVHSPFDLAACMNDLGLTEWARGRNDRAKRHIAASLRLRREIRDDLGIVKCLMNLGILADIAQQPAEAEQLFIESLTHARELGDRRNIALNLHNLGVFVQLKAEESGDHSRLRNAEQMLLESLRVSRDIGERSQICHTLCVLGDVAVLKGDTTEAASCYHEAMLIAAELGTVPVQARALLGVATLLVRLGDVRGAQEALSVITGLRAVDEHDRTRASRLLEQIRRSPAADPPGAESAASLSELVGRYAQAPIAVVAQALPAALLP